MPVPSRSARLIVAAFCLIQLTLFLRAALPLPEPWRGGWPWRMFDRRDPWEKVLEATGFTPGGRTLRIPLEELFQYRRGSTPLRAYDQQVALKDPTQRALLQAFAQTLAERMMARGVPLEAVELRWRRFHVERGEGPPFELGRFEVSQQEATP